MKIGVFEIRDMKKTECYFSAKLKGHKIICCDTPIDSKNASKYKDCDVLSIFIYSKIDKEVLDKLPKLKLITTRSTGYDHIDLEECKKRGITVCNVPYYGENTVAEHTFALILSLSRNIHKSYVRTSKNDFSIEGLQGFDLKGKTLGIIGAGHIGLHVARMAEGFGMKVLAYDKFKNNFMSEVLHFEYAELDEVLSKSDIITIHVPSLPETRHLIDAKKIALMKNGAILINTARGDIVDTDALYKALKSGKLSGAGLDVIEGEDMIKEDKEMLYQRYHDKRDKLRQLYEDMKILHMENVVYTPHNAFNSKEAIERILDTTNENILSFIAGKPINVVQIK